ncbi:MAG: nitroreductase family protein [Rikenellaceae bacterium]|jgi:nitroreductase|nr:nitroreductase family protein [Rikenellaceae bacterium]
MKQIVSILAGAVVLAAVMSSCDGTPKSSETVENEAMKKETYTDREAIETILSRKSVRQYEDRAVEAEKVELLLRAAMAAPSGMDRRPWSFVVVTERETLNRLAEGLPYAKMLTHAPLAIVVCGDPQSPYWTLDCSAATQNILLAAEALGLGAVWTATYPTPELMTAANEALGLPEGIQSLAVIPMGYPAGETAPKDKFDATRIHYNKW